MTTLRSLQDEIVYGRDSSHLRVFVSSKMNGTLDAERVVAAKAIEALHGHRAWYWERDAPMGVLHSERECTSYARSSDSIVLIVGDELSAIVLAEYEAASQGGAERYLFARGNIHRPPDVVDFLARERDHVVYREFENTAELETHLYRALTLILVRNAREQLVRRRSRKRSK